MADETGPQTAAASSPNNPFERIVATSTGRAVLSLSQDDQATTMAQLQRDREFMALIAQYKAGLASPQGFLEADEIAIRQAVYPKIEGVLQSLNPKYLMFATAILDQLLADPDWEK